MEFSNPNQFWLLIASVAGIAFIIGRATANSSVMGGGDGAQSRAEMRRRQHETADLTFSSMSASKQGEVDRLLREKKLTEAIKIVREESNLGLREAKFVVDHRWKALKGEQPF